MTRSRLAGRRYSIVVEDRVTNAVGRTTKIDAPTESNGVDSLNRPINWAILANQGEVTYNAAEIACPAS
jgi:hypothetical protein